MSTIAVRHDPARFARVFHALGDEKRLQVLDLLRHGERCVCELTGTLEVGQSLLSFHLKVLKDAGLVTDRREGRWIFYSLAHPVLEELSEFLVSPESVVAQPGCSAGSCR